MLQRCERVRVVNSTIWPYNFILEILDFTVTVDMISADMEEGLHSQRYGCRTERERKIIYAHYTGYSHEQIAKEFKITPIRVQAIIQEVLKRLRVPKVKKYIQDGWAFYYNVELAKDKEFHERVMQKYVKSLKVLDK